MRFYEMVKCKRRALRMRKETFARAISIDPVIYGRFEDGELIPKPIFDAIVYGVESYIRSLSYKEQLEMNIVANALSLHLRENEADKTKALNYILISVAKLNLEVSKENLGLEES